MLRTSQVEKRVFVIHGRCLGLYPAVRSNEGPQDGAGHVRKTMRDKSLELGMS